MSVPACGSKRACEGASSEEEVNPRARRNLLEGAFDWATLVGRGGHRGVGRALRVSLSKRCVLFRFLQVLSRIPPVF
jgi:hypothetical protein